MYGRDYDPFADTSAARYAYESDDEDDNDFLQLKPTEASLPQVDVTFLPSEIYRQDEGKTLIVATGEVGRLWARGANLGEQAGQINVNKRAIGLIFRPTWANNADATVIVSEALSHLPVWAMYIYAETVLSNWKPSRMVLLDSYSSSTYISSAPILAHEAPLRYLSTDKTPREKDLLPFEPPNLLQSTTSAFLTLLSFPRPHDALKASNSPQGLSILVPTHRVPLPYSHNLNDEEQEEESQVVNASLVFNDLDSNTSDWDTSLLGTAHRVIQQEGLSEGDESVAISEWEDISHRKKTGGSINVKRLRSLDVGGGMYI